jgi:Secretion system C-terminal sorting domain
MKKIIITVAFFCNLAALSAQNEICYTYDAAGNRTQKKQCCTGCLNDPGLEERAEALAITPKESLIVSPNPNSGLFTIQTTGFPPETKSIVFNIAGERLLEKTLGDGQFDITAYPSGTYVLMLQNGDKIKSIQIKKINP